ncbi:MAG: hypothetical protein R3C10_04045 [Pirellulales bacterium]
MAGEVLVAVRFGRTGFHVSKGLATFVEVGLALKEIRDRRLYREEYSTFEAYVDKRHGLKRTYAHYLIESAAAADQVFTVVNSAPNTERQARELARVPEEDRVEVWQEVVEQAEVQGVPVTAGPPGRQGRARSNGGWCA